MITGGIAPSVVSGGPVLIDMCRVAGLSPGQDITTALQQVINSYAGSGKAIDIYFSDPGSRSNPYLLEGAQQSGTYLGASTTTTGSVTLPQATIGVASTANLYNPGGLNATVQLGGQTVTYTGISGNNLTGCTGGSGTFGSGTTVQQALTYSAQVLFPAVNFLTAPNMPIRIRGLTHAAGGIMTTGGANGGLCIFSNATSGFAFGCIPAQNQWNWAWTGVKPVFEDVTLLFPDNPSCGGIDMRYALRGKFKGTIDTEDAWQSVTGSNNPGSELKALQLPWGFENGDIEVDGEIHGFPIAVNLAEHCKFGKIEISNCGVAFQRTSTQGLHSNSFGYADLEECGVLFDIGAGSLIVEGHVDYEDNTAGHFPTPLFWRSANSGSIYGDIRLKNDAAGSFGGGITDGSTGGVFALSITPIYWGGPPSAATHPAESFNRWNSTAFTGAAQSPGLSWPSFHMWRTTAGGQSLNVTAGGYGQASGAGVTEFLVRALGQTGQPRVINLTATVGASFDFGIRAQRVYNLSADALWTRAHNGAFSMGIGAAAGGTQLGPTLSGVISASATHTTSLEVHEKGGKPWLVRGVVDGVVLLSVALTSAQIASLMPGNTSWVEDGIWTNEGNTQFNNFWTENAEAPVTYLQKATATWTAGANETTLCTSGTFTVTLPAPTDELRNKILNSGSGTITVTPPSGTLSNLGGATGNITLTQGQSCDVISDGTNWYQVG